jgi:hypothetical protein
MMPAFRSRVAGALALIAACLCAACGTTVHDTNEPLQPESAPPQPTLPRAARRQINHTLDVFVRYGVERQGPAKAYSLASPMMRSGVTHAEWLSGSLPVPPFQSKGTSFHGYSVMAVDGNQAYLSMVLQPRHPRTQGAIAYNIRVTKHHGRWLVDWFTPSAFFAADNQPPKLFAQPDIAPSAGGDYLEHKAGANLVMVGVLTVLCLPLISVIAYVLYSAGRSRSRRRLAVPDDDRWDAALRAPAAEPPDVARRS